MTPRKAIFDTNLYVDWLNVGRHEELMLGPGLARYLSVHVSMELSAGAGTPRAKRTLSKLISSYGRVRRIAVLPAGAFPEAGRLLRTSRARGVDVTRTSLVNDLLIALTARSIGATVYTADADFERLQGVANFALAVVC